MRPDKSARTALNRRARTHLTRINADAPIKRIGSRTVQERKKQMLRRLVYLAMGSVAVLAVSSFILRYFSDIRPVATPEPQSVWRFEAAFLLTATQLISLGVVMFASLAIAILLWKSARTRTP